MNQLTDAANGLSVDMHAELAALKARLDTIVTDRVVPGIDAAKVQATASAQAAMDGIRQQADRASGTVQRHPLAALGVAALFGFTAALLIRR